MKIKTAHKAMPFVYALTFICFFLAANLNGAKAQTASTDVKSATVSVQQSSPDLQAQLSDLQKQRDEIAVKAANGTATTAEMEQLKQLDGKINEVQAQLASPSFNNSGDNVKLTAPVMKSQDQQLQNPNATPKTI